MLTTPVVRCLKQQLGAEVHYLTKSRFASILEPNPYIDRIWTFDKDLNSDLVTELDQCGFDRITDLHHNLRSFVLKMKLCRPSSAFAKLNLQKWLLVNTPIDLMPDVHIVDRYMETVSELGVKYDGEGLDYFIPPESEVDVSAWSPLLKPNQYTAFVLGATHATKRLPLEKMADICRKTRQPMVLLGGETEKAAGQWLAGQFGPNVVDTCGRLSLHQSASVVRQAGVVLTHDTGLMHIAAAFHKPVVSVWGSTVPAFGMYPFYPEGMNHNKTIEVTGLSCRPCSKIGYEKCPKGHFKCMLEIDPLRVVDGIGQ